MQPSHFIDFRREIHRNPEISGEEQETKKRVRAFLSQFHPHEVIDVGKTGLIFAFHGEGKGKSVMIRSELDGLPIQETNSFPHKSVKKGVSHKCGHDGHMAILANLAYRLSKRPLTKGSCYLLYQPAEETGEGAREVFHDERFEQLKVDRIIALHNLPGFPLGNIVVKNGPFTPAVSSIAILFKGKTSHAAEPENGNNPAAPIARFLLESLALNQTESTNRNFFLVTPIHMILGDKNYGISAGYGEVHLTLRSMDSAVLERESKRVESLARTIAIDKNLDIEIHYLQEFKANVNHPPIVDDIRKAAKSLKREVLELSTPMKWGEDFGLFSEHIPGAMFGLGAGENCPALHNPDYDFPDTLIEIGGEMFETIVRDFLN